LADSGRSVHSRTTPNLTWKTSFVCTGGTGRLQVALGVAEPDLQVSDGEDGGSLPADGVLQYSANEGPMRIEGAWCVRVGVEGERVVAREQ
jgi:hypothetical protein